MSAPSATIDVSLPDGSVRTLPQGSTGLDLAKSIGSRLAKAAVAAVIDGSESDLGLPLPSGAVVAIITSDSEAGRHVLRHSTAHVLAQAVLQLYPGAKFTIGPAIEDGFYYDFDLPGGLHVEQDPHHAWRELFVLQQFNGLEADAFEQVDGT